MFSFFDHLHEISAQKKYSKRFFFSSFYSKMSFYSPHFSAKLDEYYESQLVYRLYQKWKLKFDRKKSENEKNLQIEAIQKRILVIYFYENWKHGK
jgi:hypothetical protein